MSIVYHTVIISLLVWMRSRTLLNLLRKKMQAQPRLLAPQVSPRLHRYSLHIGILSILGNGSLSRLFYPWVFCQRVGKNQGSAISSLSCARAGWKFLLGALLRTCSSRCCLADYFWVYFWTYLRVYLWVRAELLMHKGANTSRGIAFIDGLILTRSYGAG